MLYGKTIVITGVVFGHRRPHGGARAATRRRRHRRRFAHALAVAWPSFIEGDLSTARGRRGDRRASAAAFRRSLQRRRRLGHARRGQDAGDQFLWPARAVGRRGAAFARGRRRSSTSPRSPAMAGAPISNAPRRWSASRVFPIAPEIAGTSCDRRRRRLSGLERGAVVMDAARRPSSAVQGARHPGQRGQSGAGGDADPAGIPDDIRRRARR